MPTLTVNKEITIELESPIGVYFSGGIDSSLLVYLLLDQLPNETIHLYTTHYPAGASGGQSDIAQRTADVLSVICELTKNNNVEHHIMECASDVQIIGHQLALAKKLLHQDKTIKSLIAGNNRLPNIAKYKDYKTFQELINKRNLATRLVLSSLRDNNDLNKDPNEKTPYGVIEPIINLDKQQICKIYHDNNILDTLLPATVSCADIIYSGGQGSNSCGNCFWCVEREWGLEFDKSN